MDYDCNHDAVVSFAVGHSIPFLRALKASYRNAVKKIYGTDGIVPMDIMGVAMAQEVLSAVFIFLLLLALRNHFKIK